MKLKDLSDKIGVSEGQLRKWKSEDKWKSKLSNIQTPSARGAPKGSKNNLKTGMFEKIFFDTLNDDELVLISSVDNNKIKALEKELALLTVREYRVMKRIEETKNKVSILSSVQNRKLKNGNGSLTEDELTTNSLSQFEALDKLEETLTKIQDKKIRTIATIAKLEIDYERLQIEKGDSNNDIDTISTWLNATKPNAGQIEDLFAIDAEVVENEE